MPALAAAAPRLAGGTRRAPGRRPGVRGGVRRSGGASSCRGARSGWPRSARSAAVGHRVGSINVVEIVHMPRPGARAGPDRAGRQRVRAERPSPTAGCPRRCSPAVVEHARERRYRSLRARPDRRQRRVLPARGVRPGGRVAAGAGPGHLTLRLRTEPRPAVDAATQSVWAECARRALQALDLATSSVRAAPCGQPPSRVRPPTPGRGRRAPTIPGMARVRPGEAANPAPPTVARIRLRFAKRGRLRFLSHRDVARSFERAVRRAGHAGLALARLLPAPAAVVGRRRAHRGGQRGRVRGDRAHRAVEPAASRAALDAALPGRPRRARRGGCRGHAAGRPDRRERWSIELPGVAPDVLRAAPSPRW